MVETEQSRKGGPGVGGRVLRIDVVNFSVIVSKRNSSIVVCTFLISRTVSQDPFQVKKKVFDTELSREGGHWVREGVADRSGHWTRVD